MKRQKKGWSHKSPLEPELPMEDATANILQQFQVRSSDPRHACSVCKLLLRKPCQTECGCYMCESCATELFQTTDSTPCPGATADCVTLTRQSIRADVAKRREVQHILLRCPFSLQCDKTVLVFQLSQHFAQCQHLPVSCSFCGQRVARGELNIHQQDQCTEKRTICSNCKLPFTRQFLNQVHLNRREPECDKFRAPCPFCGFGELDKDGLKQHSTSCSNWMVCCPFHAFGCQFEGKENEMKEHVKTQMVLHCNMLLKFVLNFGKTVTDLEKLLELVKKLFPGDLEQEAFNKVVEEVDRLTLQMSQPSGAATASHSGVLDSIMENVNDLKARTWPEGVFIWKVPQFRRKREEARARRDFCLVSEPFYSCKQTPGYKMRLRLYPNGKDAGEGRCLSLYFQFVTGDYDDVLSWPFSSCVRLQILDKLSSSRTKTETFRSTPSADTYQRPRTYEGSPSAGSPTFVDLASLENTYMHEDSIFLTCTVVDFPVSSM